jgi:hypothetical protein
MNHSFLSGFTASVVVAMTILPMPVQAFFMDRPMEPLMSGIEHLMIDKNQAGTSTLEVTFGQSELEMTALQNKEGNNISTEGKIGFSMVLQDFSAFESDISQVGPQVDPSHIEGGMQFLFNQRSLSSGQDEFALEFLIDFFNVLNPQTQAGSSFIEFQNTYVGTPHVFRFITDQMDSIDPDLLALYMQRVYRSGLFDISMPQERVYEFSLVDNLSYFTLLDLYDATRLLVPQDSEFQNELIMDIDPEEFIELTKIWKETMQYIDFKMTIVVDKSDYIQSQDVFLEIDLESICAQFDITAPVTSPLTMISHYARSFQQAEFEVIEPQGETIFLPSIFSLSGI